MQRNDFQIGAVDGGEQADGICHARMVGKEKNWTVGRHMLASMHTYIFHIMFAHELMGGFGEVGLAGIPVEVQDLLRESPGGPGEGLTEEGSEKRLLFPSEGGDKIVEIDLGEYM